MKALPLWQPWATLVAIGAKRIETRDYPPERQGLRVGDRIAIYATKGPGEDGEAGLRRQCAEPAFAAALKGFGYGYEDGRDPLPRGAIVCTCVLLRAAKMELAAIESLRKRNPREHAFGRYRLGRWAWVLDDVELLDPPLPATTTHQGPFDWEPDRAAQEPLS